MKLRIKSLPNLVGRRGCVLLQSNAWSCLGSHVARQQWTYELWRSDGGPIFRQMVRSHEIRDRIHVSEQSMDFGGLARWSASHWDKWIFKKKTDVDGNVTVYEARLVAKSFSQVQGVDYDEIFSSVAMLKVRRNHVSISCIYEIWQMDVKTSFLTSFRKERLYVIQSERFCRS